MMAMANGKPALSWRNFAAWSALGGIFYMLVVSAAIALKHGNALDLLLRQTKVTAELALGLIFAMATVGFTSRKRRLSLRYFRNFLIQNLVAITAFLLVIWGFSALARTGSIGVSQWIAAVTGATLVVLACLGTLTTASAHTGADLIDHEIAAEEMRERGRLFFCSFAWMAAYGLLLIILSLAGPGGVLSPAAALAGALALIGVLTILLIAAWRLSDELGRTLSHETGNTAFYLIWVVGGAWAMLAHLGFTAAPAPLDWLTLFTVLMFAAAFIATGRRKLLTR